VALGWEQAAHLISNCLTNINFTDMEIWYQAFPIPQKSTVSVSSPEDHGESWRDGICGYGKLTSATGAGLLYGTRRRLRDAGFRQPSKLIDCTTCSTAEIDR
jgi:hypothetical protein